MNTNWAEEHLQTIRTLMERSAVYRRALSPIAIFVGVAGILGALVAWFLKIESAGAFATFWMAVGVISVAGAFLLVRKQALKQRDEFWSPPTRRVVQGMAPALLVGGMFGIVVAGCLPQAGTLVISMLLILWTLLYGLALQAAGFFMPRGIRLFGWGFLVAGTALIGLLTWVPLNRWDLAPHWIMGGVFGASHLAYGVYLHFTEPRKIET